MSNRTMLQGGFGHRTLRTTADSTRNADRWAFLLLDLFGLRLRKGFNAVECCIVVAHGERVEN